MSAESMEELVSLCRRRGFIFQSCELYGGLQGVYDYGSLGVELNLAPLSIYLRQRAGLDEPEGAHTTAC